MIHQGTTNSAILIVEDERPLAEAIKLKLEKTGFETMSARTVEQALNYLQEIPTIQAIWLDHYLIGKESGLDFVTKVKAHGGAWRSLPIFVVSNTASPDKVQSYLHLGISKYYVKSDHKLADIISDISHAVAHPEPS